LEDSLRDQFRSYLATQTATAKQKLENNGFDASAVRPGTISELDCQTRADSPNLKSGDFECNVEGNIGSGGRYQFIYTVKLPGKARCWTAQNTWAQFGDSPPDTSAPDANDLQGCLDN
jgi:hypothetical protein